jgi:hypothetical protein
MALLDRRRSRYKGLHLLALNDVRDDLKTGDILLFHKASRSGILDTLEMDLIAPLFFRETEFRHCGIVVRRDDSLAVLECADEFHSGHHIASYPWGKSGIREVNLEPLLGKYAEDNADAHFGVRFIPNEIPLDRMMEAIQQIGPVSYLNAYRFAWIYFSRFVLPRRLFTMLVDIHATQMMCSEFVHATLARCGALGEYTSKVFAPYIIENAEHFQQHDRVGYSDIVRFA